MVLEEWAEVFDLAEARKIPDEWAKIFEKVHVTQASPPSPTRT
jgi:hypothetical protein